MELQRGYGQPLALIEEAERQVSKTHMIMSSGVGDRLRECGDAVNTRADAGVATQQGRHGCGHRSL